MICRIANVCTLLGDMHNAEGMKDSRSTTMRLEAATAIAEAAE